MFSFVIFVVPSVEIFWFDCVSLNGWRFSIFYSTLLAFHIAVSLYKLGREIWRKNGKIFRSGRTIKVFILFWATKVSRGSVPPNNANISFECTFSNFKRVMTTYLQVISIFLYSFMKEALREKKFCIANFALKQHNSDLWSLIEHWMVDELVKITAYKHSLLLTFELAISFYSNWKIGNIESYYGNRLRICCHLYIWINK